METVITAVKKYSEALEKIFKIQCFSLDTFHI